MKINIFSFCKFAKRWMITETPKKCCNHYDCNNCEYYEKRVSNKYISSKLKKLEKENI